MKKLSIILAYFLVAGSSFATQDYTDASNTVVSSIDNANYTARGYSSVISGTNNVIQTNAEGSVIIAGRNNDIESSLSESTKYSTIVGGRGHKLHFDADYSIIGGGRDNNIHDNSAFGIIGGGLLNSIKHGTSYNFIGGGSSNIIHDDSLHSAIIGGENNEITNSVAHGLAFGKNSIVAHSGSTVLTDGSGTGATSLGANSLTLGYTGGTSFNDNDVTNISEISASIVRMYSAPTNDQDVATKGYVDSVTIDNIHAYFRIPEGGQQSFANTGWIVITNWGSDYLDGNLTAVTDAGGATTAVVINVEGVYEISGGGSFETDGATTIRGRVFTNGVRSYLGAYRRDVGASATQGSFSIGETAARFQVGDHLDFRQSNGTTSVTTWNTFAASIDRISN